MTKKKSMSGVSDILCPLLKETKFDIQSDKVYKIWNDQMVRYAYGRDIIIENGIVSVSESFIQTYVNGWSDRDNVPGNNPTYTLCCRGDLDNNGQFKINYFNIVEILNEKWISISVIEAKKLVDFKIKAINEEFLTYLKTAPFFIKFYFWFLGDKNYEL